MNKKNMVKEWLMWFYFNDKNNAIFDTYNNEYLNSYDSDYEFEWKEDNIENFKEILKDNAFLKFVLVNVGLENIIKDLKELEIIK